MILTPIEQSIKSKIESVGVPLKDWNISINYGIKTGYNPAFIINKEKRDEILKNCKTQDEYKRTDELIRPILRGKDINKYSYEFGNEYLITTYNKYTDSNNVTHPSININDFPAVKAHLDQYWGRINKRQDKGDTPYNLRRCAYMDDFNKPKLIWKVIGNKVAFALDKKKYLLNNACYMLTGEHIEYLTVMLNSPEITWYSFITNMNKTGMGEVQIGKQNINLLPIPQDIEIIEKLKEKLDMYLSGKINIKYFETSSESIIAKVYGLNEKERSFLIAFKANL